MFPFPEDDESFLKRLFRFPPDVDLKSSSATEVAATHSASAADVFQHDHDRCKTNLAKGVEVAQTEKVVSETTDPEIIKTFLKEMNLFDLLSVGATTSVGVAAAAPTGGTGGTAPPHSDVEVDGGTGGTTPEHPSVVNF